ncbi:hypothetical protein [Candidatus Midichloria mitochondrii]|uniref:Uncharacterized protein n=1 Tax=Midichloria mitochondrii (strain IricVA) TaxID=696127 RepID=F7XWG5_MIDMI|nr:hypothetical protein [Candidatus Midichloria mitochondrii]AEI89014.1 hypothetical protein midi_00720 [Candidatus Midichloria mitochondrii IricVA]
MITNYLVNLHRPLSSVLPHAWYAQRQANLSGKNNCANNTEFHKQVTGLLEKPTLEGNDTNVKLLLACVRDYIHNLFVSCARQDPDSFVRQAKKAVHFTDYNAHVQRLTGCNCGNESPLDTATATHYESNQDSHYFGREPSKYSSEEGYIPTESYPEYKAEVLLLGYEGDEGYNIILINPTIFTD